MAAHQVVALAGALDTKGDEYAFVRKMLAELGVDTLMIDVGVRGHAQCPADVSRFAVAERAGTSLGALAAQGERSSALDGMATGLSGILEDLGRTGRLAGVFGMGGSGAVALLAPAFRQLPLGLPKVILTTMAASDTRDVIGASDLILIPSVVDIAGLNTVSRFVLTRSAHVIRAMAGVSLGPPRSDGRLVAASMFGVTTSAVDAGRRALEARALEVIVLHANGVGGQTLERLAAEGWLIGVLDLTTSELLDEVVGGVASAGPDRLTGAGRRGIPQVVSVGGCDIINFGPRSSVPSRFEGRVLYQHGPMATLMRSSVDECRQVGTLLGERVLQAIGPTAVVVPTRGLSALSAPGGPFCDPDADHALLEALTDVVAGKVDVHRVDVHANAPEFGSCAAEVLATIMYA